MFLTSRKDSEEISYGRVGLNGKAPSIGGLSCSSLPHMTVCIHPDRHESLPYSARTHRKLGPAIHGALARAPQVRRSSGLRSLATKDASRFGGEVPVSKVSMQGKNGEEGAIVRERERAPFLYMANVDGMIPCMRRGPS